jgi:hypothetical protein
MKTCPRCHGSGAIKESPCDGCEYGSASWLLINDSVDWKTGKKKHHVKHTDCSDTCIPYKMWKERQKDKSKVHPTALPKKG